MEKLKMQSRDVVGGNVAKIAALFPQCVTEHIGKDGKPELAIDFDNLRAELSNEMHGDIEERYQFTWPDKKDAARLANELTTMTLRPCREESADFDTTQNLYIEGDNLDVLKLLRDICEIGKERIRRAGAAIRRGAINCAHSDKAMNNEVNPGLFDDDDSTRAQCIAPLPDTGFRVLKLDSSNMEDVFYRPEDFEAKDILTSVDNVKADREPLDLLFQVTPELNIELSAKIEEKDVNGKKVFFVDDTYLIATFDTEVNESTITEIAKMQPQYFVMRDASAANDNVLDNFEQIFRHYSPDTIRKIL